MSTQHDSEFWSGRATYDSLADEVDDLRAQLRYQTQRADRWLHRHNDAALEREALVLTVRRVRKCPRYATADGQQVVSAAALDQALREWSR